MFAFNNVEIDYITLAIVNSKLAQKHLGISKEQVTIVTDEYSYDYACSKHTKEFVTSSAEYILQEKDIEFKYKNMRLYKDTSDKARPLSFYNLNRSEAYDLSPYEETILLDADFLILSDTLNRCWGHNNELMMSYDYTDILGDREYSSLSRLNSVGITMYWATVVYFKKGAYAESFFNLVKQVAANILYYKQLYKWPGNLYRNDYSFSVAAHNMGGFVDRTIPQLPFALFKSFDIDDIERVLGENELLILAEKSTAQVGDYIAIRWKDLDIHIMNKWALERILGDLLENL